MSWRSAVLHLGGLWTLAFVQPLFDLLGRNAAFFVARGNTAGDVLILAFTVTFAVPLAAAVVVALAWRAHRRAGQAVLLGFVAALAAVLALQVVKPVSPHATVVLPIAAVLGIAAAAAYARWAPVRTFTSILGVAPVVVLVLLLLLSPVRGVLLPGDEVRAASSGATIKRPVPVVLIVFDELPTTTLMKRDLSIDARRFPSFARLAAQADWYRNATSVADGTYVALPAVLTGKRPQAELPTSHQYPDNLFTLLGRAYDQHDQEPITSVCPATLCGERAREDQGGRLRSLAEDLSIVERRLLLPSGMAAQLPPIDRDWEGFRAEGGTDAPLKRGDDLPARRIRQGRAVVRTMKPGGARPGLWMVHYVIPHVPWRFEADGSQYAVAGPTIPGLDDQDWGRDPFLLDQAYQRHLLMTRFADRLLGEAMDRMKATGLWDKALVIVAADHGGAVGPGQSRRPVTPGNFPQVAGVPLFVKPPGQRRGTVRRTFATTLDVVPTIAKQLGVRTDWRFDGLPVGAPHPARLLRQRNGREARLVGVRPEDFVRRRNAEVRARDARWPAGNRAIYRVGPRQDLVGTSPPATTEGPASGFLNNARLYRDVEPASGLVPAYVTGATKGVAPGTDLAVAVNGIVRGTGEAYVDHGDPRFSVLVPPESLRKGRNQVAVYAVAGSTWDQLDSTG